MSWTRSTYTGGKFVPIADLITAGTHRLEAWGNALEGWVPYLVQGSIGIPIGPHFSPRHGGRLSDLKDAARRVYGPVKVHKGRAY